MFSLKDTGSFSKTFKFLEKAENISNSNAYKSIGDEGVIALQNATPKRSGLTASSWSYELDKKGDDVSINWVNNNENQGRNIAILIQYGHGTGTGGYVPAYDYINPAMRIIFDSALDELWKEVSS